MVYYISLGCDCSVSYNLRKLCLQKCGTMPFDWMKLMNINNLVDILDNDFRDVYDYSKYIKKKQNPVFDNQQNLMANMSGDVGVKSLVKLVHMEYGFILPHESVLDTIDVLEFEKKYSRRVERFRCVVKDNTICKVFVRLLDKNNCKDTIDNRIKKQNLELALSRYGCCNFEIKYINDTNLPEHSMFDWKREYLPWQSLMY